MRTEQEDTSGRTADSLECPRCHRQFDPKDVGGKRRGRHCPGCGSRLIAAGSMMETEVRRQLYGRRLQVIGVASPGSRSR